MVERYRKTAPELANWLEANVPESLRECSHEMKGPAASRWASSELNSIASPSSVDFRV
jgi:hypothetical protein